MFYHSYLCERLFLILELEDITISFRFSDILHLVTVSRISIRPLIVFTAAGENWIPNC